MNVDIQTQGAERVLAEFPGDKFTPLGLALKLQARALLESASFQKGRERYSILLLKEAFTLQQEGEELRMLKDSGREGWKRQPVGQGDILDALAGYAAEHDGLPALLPLPGRRGGLPGLRVRPALRHGGASGSATTRWACRRPASCSGTCTWSTTITPSASPWWA